MSGGVTKIVGGAKRVAPGVLTFGLGGDHSAMIVGFPFSLGSIVIEYSPGGEYGHTPAAGRQEKYLNVRITITFKGQKYRTSYTVKKKLANVLIRVTSFINKVTTNIKVKANWIRYIVRIGVNKIWQMKK